MMSDQQALVSIVIPCYNHDMFVQETIQSVIDQDYINIELIIIDDGSSDSSVAVIQSMVSACKERFSRFEFRSRPNRGLCATLNEGLEWCNGVFFSAIASDDIYLNNKVGFQVEYLTSNPSVAACCGGIQEVNESGVLFNKRVSKEINSYSFNDIMRFKYFLPAATLMIRSSFLSGSEVYPEKHIVEDFYLYLKLTSVGNNIVCLNKVLSKYRRHDNNSSKLQFREHALDRLKIISEYRDRHVFYESTSLSYLIEATQVLGFSKLQSLTVFIDGLRAFPANLFSLRALRYFLYFFAPKTYILKKLSL